jgi:hypothetical protein
MWCIGDSFLSSVAIWENKRRISTEIGETQKSYKKWISISWESRISKGTFLLIFLPSSLCLCRSFPHKKLTLKQRHSDSLFVSLSWNLWLITHGWVVYMLPICVDEYRKQNRTNYLLITFADGVVVRYF